MKKDGLFLQIRMEKQDSVPEVILNGERYEFIQLLEMSVGLDSDQMNSNMFKLRLRHFEKGEERGTKYGGVAEVYLESLINSKRYE